MNAEWFEMNWADITGIPPDTSRFVTTPIQSFSEWMTVTCEPDRVGAGGRYRWCGFVATQRGLVRVSEMTRRRAEEVVNSLWSPIL